MLATANGADHAVLGYTYGEAATSTLGYVLPDWTLVSGPDLTVNFTALSFNHSNEVTTVAWKGDTYFGHSPLPIHDTSASYPVSLLPIDPNAPTSVRLLVQAPQGMSLWASPVTAVDDGLTISGKTDLLPFAGLPGVFGAELVLEPVAGADALQVSVYTYGEVGIDWKLVVPGHGGALRRSATRCCSTGAPRRVSTTTGSCPMPSSGWARATTSPQMLR